MTPMAAAFIKRQPRPGVWRLAPAPPLRPATHHKRLEYHRRAVRPLCRPPQPHHARHTHAVRRRAGFTLVEILVALAIIAIALTAGMRALAQATDTASALKART